MRTLSMAMVFTLVMLTLASLGRTDTYPDTTHVFFETPESQQRYAMLHSVMFMEETTSIPFSGETTPPGILIFISPTSPPTGYDAGELYLYVNEARGWELK